MISQKEKIYHYQSFLFPGYHSYLYKANRWIKGHFLRISIYMKDPQVVEYRYQAAYGLQEFLSDLGGSLGLWMGFSILTVVELFELIPRWLLRFNTLSALTYAQKSEVHHTQKENSNMNVTTVSY